jgi:hypothetical protein
MPEGTTKSTLAIIGIVGILVLGVVCITFAGGGSLIQGMGNSSNRIYANRIADEVAEAIAESSVVPEVSDDELRATYVAIRDRARSGDLEAAMVVFRVAQIQRVDRRR